MRALGSLLVSVALAIIAILAASVVASSPIVNASCGPANAPRDRLASDDVDAAFVGTLLGVGAPFVLPGTEANTAEYRFAVERWVKGGDGTAEVTILGPFATSVDFPFRQGERAGVFVNVEDGRPHSSGCSIADPDVLLAAAAPLPDPDGVGPAAILVGGGFGDYRLVALDTRGRLLGYGRGAGTIERIAVCPGAKRIVELVGGSFDASPRIAIRDVATLTVEREIDLRAVLPGQDIYPSEVVCRDEAATDIIAWSGEAGLVSIAPEPTILSLASGNRAILSTKQVAYVDIGGTEVRLGDLAGGEPRVLRRFVPVAGGYGDVHDMAFDPSATHLAIVDGWTNDQGGGATTLTVVAVEGPAEPVLSLVLPQVSGSYTVDWLDERTMLLVAGAGEEADPAAGTVRVIRVPDGTDVEGWTGWSARRAAVADGVMFAFGGAAFALGGRLIAVAASGGQPASVYTFDSQATALAVLPAFDGDTLLAAVRARAEADPSPSTSPDLAVATDPGVVGASPGAAVALIAIAAFSVAIAAGIVIARRRRGEST